MNHHFKVMSVVLLTLVFSNALYATEKCVIKSGWMERPSYQYADQKRKPQGFDIDYMRALAQDLSCDMVFKRMPWLRQNKEMIAGRIDFLPGALPTGNDSDLITVSDSYRSDPIGFYVHKNDLSLTNDNNITALLGSGFKLGIVSYDTHSPEVEELLKSSTYKNKIFPIRSTHALLRNISKKRIRAIMLHSAEVDYLRSVNDPLVKDLELVPHLSFITPAHFILGIASPLGENFVERVNGSIKRLKENGVNYKLLKKHVPSHFEITE